MTNRNWLGAAILLTWLAVPVGAAPLTSVERNAIGLTGLIDRLGAEAPTGAGVSVAHVEATFSQTQTVYFPDTSLSDFAGVAIQDVSQLNAAGKTSLHASIVGQGLYGSGGAAPEVSQVDVFFSDTWVNQDALRVQNSQAPHVATQAVQNHSWIAQYADTDRAADIMRRLDLVVDRDRVVSVVGVDNSATFPVSLANSYNTIAVGISGAGQDGNGSSFGPTTLDAPGRSKPDIVAPAAYTSWATSWVSGASALLIETARNHASAADADHPQTIKAALLAGATKAEFPTWSRTSTRPLDLRYGAGELNVDNSQRILAGPQQEASSDALVSGAGWDFGTIEAAVDQLYYFEVPERQVAQLSAVATWHRRIDLVTGSAGAAATLTPSLANLDLRLFEASGFALGSLVDESVSTIDNVEHIFRQGLKGGQYALDLTSDLDWEYALAWQSIFSPLGDMNGDGMFNNLDISPFSLALADPSGFAAQYPGVNADLLGDMNEDGAFNNLDIQSFVTYLTGQTLPVENLPGLLTPGASAVPEPDSWSLCLAALACLCLARRAGHAGRHRSGTFPAFKR